MAASKDVLGFIDASREVRRPPLVRMQFLHQRVMGSADLLRARPRFKAKDLIGLLFRHFAGARAQAAPRCRTVLDVVTPSGMTAVKIRSK